MPGITRPSKFLSLCLTILALALVFPFATAQAEPPAIGLQASIANNGVYRTSRIDGGAVIGETNRDYEGQNVIFYGGRSSLSSKHTFASLTLMGGAVLRQDTPDSVDVSDLTISGGSTYTLASGGTLNITNSLTITGNSTLLVQGKDNTAKVGGKWVGTGGTINARIASIEAGSKISADGQGYTGVSNAQGNGPGGGITAYTGGSYGGLGGASSNNAAAGVIYGSASQPVDLGSAGGGGYYYAGTGGNGGGAIRLVVTETLTLNGLVSANGAAGTGSAGGGAGGSVWVTTATLAGSGSFTANGGAPANGSGITGGYGGGGRVAVYYTTATAFTGFTTSTVTAAGSGIYAGQPGTAGFFDTSVANQQLYVYTIYTIPPDSTLTYGALTLKGAGLLQLGGGADLTIQNELRVDDTATLLVQAKNNTATVGGQWTGSGATLHAKLVTVATGAKISANGQGYTGVSNSQGNGPGGGITWYTGGSYAGLGGASDHNAAAGVIYGSASQPVDLGSAGGGGGYYSGTGGNGGGAIRLFVSDTLTLNGVISANGATGTGSAGGGAGGSIWVTTATLAGSGSLTANGGAPANGSGISGGNGGGGRVAIYYTTATSFTGFTTSTVTAGSGAYAGQPGTAGFFDTTVANLKLSVYTNYAIPADSTLTYGVLNLKSSALLLLGGGSDLTVQNELRLDDTATLLVQAKNNTATVGGQWTGSGAAIHAKLVTVAAGAKISADGQGYTGILNSGGNGPGGGTISYNGGGYGGKGGVGYGGTPGSVYGSATQPVDLGSAGGGGSYYQGVGGNGGGAIRLSVSDTLTLNGLVSANGATGTGTSGGGAGGSIWVTTATLAGSGSFTANGGTPANGGTNGGYGGGGRVAVYYTTATAFTGFTTSTVTAGSGTYAGQPGTAGFFDTSVPGLQLNVYTNYAIPPDSTLTYGAITLNGASSFILGGGSNLTVTGALTLNDSSVITIQSKYTDGQVGSGWAGVGSTITARSANLATGAKISADGQGYTGLANARGNGPGAGSAAYGGGSYGGAGGGVAGITGLPGMTYGMPLAPVDLGSAGGGGGYYTGIGGAGGGAIRLIVMETFTLNGTVSANGAAGVGAGGGGSGGAIWVTLGVLSGSGKFSANGATVTGSACGGGGGRIAVYTTDSSAFSFSTSTVAGGSGYAAGQAGTLSSAASPTSLFLSPHDDLLHGAQLLEAVVFGTPTSGGTVEFTAVGATQTYPLGSASFTLTGRLNWDTTTVPDGRYELKAVFKNASAQIIAQASRMVSVNNTAIWHSGRITSPETWNPDQVHIVTGQLAIASGATLTLNPGVIVKFAPLAGLTVESGGILNAVATPSQAVILTSLADDSAGGDTNLDGNTSLPQPGDWNGLQVLGTGQANLNANVILRYSRSSRGGALASSETWTGSCLYRITTGLTIPNGITLTIQAGAVIKFDLQQSITIQTGGKLVVQGSVSQPVIFTSVRDDSVAGDSNYDGNLTSPAPGDWLMIDAAGGTATIDHAIFSYGGGSTTGGWNSSAALRASSNNSASLTITNSTINQALYDGLLVQNGTSSLTSSVVTGSDRGVVAWLGNATVNVTNSTFDGNKKGLLAHGGTLTVTNTIVTNSSVVGIEVDINPAPTVTYSDVWCPAATNGNYKGFTDPTHTNGNISADPRYANRSQGNYRLNYLSPAIDAANGSLAPATDMMGAARYDDPRTPNTGTGTPPYADIGAYEFVETASSNVDLVVSNISGPASALAGDTIILTWTDTNQGTGQGAMNGQDTTSGTNDQAVGPWHDTVNLVLNPDTNPQVIFAGEFLVAQGVTLGARESTTVSVQVRVPGSVVGSHAWQVATNSRGEVFEGVNSGNNTAVSASRMTLDLPELVVGGAAISSQFSAVGEAHWFKLNPASGQDILISLDLAASDGISELYLAKGYMPTRQQFDEHGTPANAANVQVLAAGTVAQTYYLLAYPRQLSGPTGFTLSAQSLAFSLNEVSPTTVANQGSATLQLSGGALRADMIYEIVEPGGATAHAATSINWVNSTQVFATFNMAGLPTGAYTVRARYGGVTKTAPAPVNVISGTPGQVEITLTTPNALRSDWEGSVVLHYRNTGNSDMLAPLMLVEATNAQIRLENAWNYYGSSLFLLGINSQGPAGILPPGASGSINLFIKPTINDGQINVSVSVLTEQQGNQAYDWDAIKSTLRPPSVPTDAWEAVFTNFKTEVGSTIGQFQAVMADDATYLSRLGIYQPDVGELLSFELVQANALDLTQRYTLGAFGRGSPAFWEIAAISDPSGDVRIQAGAVVYNFRATPSLNTPQGSTTDEQGRQVLSFAESPTSTDTWYAVPGNETTLTKVNGVFHWRDHLGDVVVFRSDGKLDYSEDTNGNRVTAVYTGNQVTRLDHSDGDKLLIAYNAQGRVQQLTAPTGQVLTFTYDASGEHLMTMATPQSSASFQYASDQNPLLRHAVTSITFSDGTHRYFEYDSKGRLYRRYLDQQVDLVTFTYDSAGGVTMTDALGNQNQVSLDENGLTRQSISPTGEITRFIYDQDLRMTQIVAPLGAVSTYEYDSSGNQAGSISPLGSRTSMVYDLSASGLNRLLAAQDESGATTHYTYDAHGNLLAIDYPDGSREEFTYDSHGNRLSHTNARSQTTGYTYTDKNLLLTKNLPGGAQLTYTYDSHRNLLTATGPAGVTHYEYNTRDLLTKVTYPNGRSLTITYDNGGRRTRSQDDQGYAVVYTYDAAGRLARLNAGDGSLIVRYTYNAASMVTRQDMGNGTYTTYEYDASGRMLKLHNYNSSGTLLSKYDYSYDALSRITSLTTQQGEWDFAYDPAGQLTSVSIPGGRLITYEYLNGNRAKKVDNGVTTLYTYNNLNQLVSAGADSYTYDADGNLASRSNGGQTWNYTYDDANQLTGVSGPDGNTTYIYDAMGNRIAMIKDGVRTDFLLDPGERHQLFGEYTAGGSPLANYAFGRGLVSRTAGSTSLYYQFDGSSNTVALTDGSGAVQNTYSYLPFGELLSSTGSQPNPFGFGGEFGMYTVSSNQVLTFARLYDPTVGRFTSRDWLQVPAENPYLYASNNPLTSIDTLGFEEEKNEGIGFDDVREFVMGITPDMFEPLMDKIKDLKLEAGLQSLKLSRYADARGFAITARLDRAAAVRWVREAKVWGTGAKWVGRLGTWMGVVDAFKAWRTAYGTLNAPNGKWDGWQLTHDTGMAVGKTMSIFLKNIPLAGTLLDGWDYGTNYLFDWYYGNLKKPAPVRGNGGFGVVSSRDPNDILGPAGYGPDRWINPGPPITYTIHFENAATASAPAQIVRVHQVLDANLDLNSLQLAGYGMGNKQVIIPAGVSEYHVRLDLRSSAGLYVDVTVTLNPATRELVWEFKSVDPVTGQAPQDPYKGFLPPDKTPPEGQGYVTYTIQPKANLPSGTHIAAMATIIFDSAPMDTPQITHTLDGLPPVSSSVSALPAKVSPTFTVSWSGSDDPGGSGIGSYDVYVSTDGGVFLPWLLGTTKTAELYPGQNGHSYAFYCVATDHAGNQQAYNPATQASTQVPKGLIYLPLIRR